MNTLCRMEEVTYTPNPSRLTMILNDNTRETVILPVVLFGYETLLLIQRKEHKLRM
jgi:hypothetical protein